MIDAAFKGDSVEAMIAVLGANSGEFAQKALKAVTGHSPLAMKTTLAAIRRARSLPSLERALEIEFRLCIRLFEGGEFTEGIRALLVDKDRKPAWKPPRYEDVTAAMVEDMFATLPGAGDIRL
jgi:enoyl-CoA hydratase